MPPVVRYKMLYWGNPQWNFFCLKWDAAVCQTKHHFLIFQWYLIYIWRKYAIHWNIQIRNPAKRKFPDMCTFIGQLSCGFLNHNSNWVFSDLNVSKPVIMKTDLFFKVSFYFIELFLLFLLFPSTLSAPLFVCNLWVVVQSGQKYHLLLWSSEAEI